MFSSMRSIIVIESQLQPRRREQAGVNLHPVNATDLPVDAFTVRSHAACPMILLATGHFLNRLEPVSS